MENQTVLEVVGKDGQLVFLDTNLGGTKRIMVTLVNKAGEKRETFCSEAVSAQLRAGTRTKDSLLHLNVKANDEGRWIIQRNPGNEIVVNVASLSIVAAKQTVATFEEAMGY